MNSVCFIIDNLQQLTKTLEQSGIFPRANCVVRIHTTTKDMQEALSFAQEAKAFIPHAHIIGSSSSSVLFKGHEYTNKTLIIIEQYFSTEIYSGIVLYRNSNEKSLAKSILSLSHTHQPNILHLLTTNVFQNSYGLLQSIKEKDPLLKVVGGVVSSTEGCKPFVFDERFVTEEGCSVLYLESSLTSPFYCSVNNAAIWDPNFYEITEADGNSIITIDEKPAVRWVMDYFDSSFKIPYIAVSFEDNLQTSLFLEYSEERERLCLENAIIEDGARFRMSYLSSLKGVQESFRICSELVTVPVESFFCYYSKKRKSFLKGAEIELEPLAHYDVCGVFTEAEFVSCSNSNTVELANAGLVITAFAETETYILPNFNVYKAHNLYKVDEFSQQFCDYICKKQNENGFSMLHEIKERILLDSDKVNKTNQDFDLPNLFQYKEDYANYHFSNIFLISLENYDALSAAMGPSSYYLEMIQFINNIQDEYQSHPVQQQVNLYILNPALFIVAPKNPISFDEFKDFMYQIYLFCKDKHLSLPQYPLNLKFISVSGVQEPLQDLVTAFRSTRKDNEMFIHFNKDYPAIAENTEQTQMIDVINKSLDKNLVVPYYQLIHNNVNSANHTYEALIRIVDDEKVYMPSDFLNLAKEHSLYTQLSQAMILQVLHDFRDKDCQVSINLNSLDIENEKFLKFLFQQVEKFPTPQNIIFEVVADDGKLNVEALKAFILRARFYGVKIAIDDFGAGYFNLYELVTINPDFIKVDGAIVRVVHKEENSLNVLKTILYMSEKLGVQLVAEHVENEEVQKIVEELGIDYSQGFHFSEPKPLEDIFTK